MKILSLKFKNINSLAGEWNIDLTKPQFTDNGIFVITGKTGAGKTSILDAISLALYGRTPRVEIKSSSNEVMTHGTNDCYSEITFEIGGKKWKSSWKQERNRSGKLNPVNRQIADGSNKIYAEQSRNCDKKIAKIIGLTFEQFTKVIMLAQGSFAAFLQANKNDKGELLEQITGTEIYGEISRKVFERNKIEREKLERIALEIGAIKILSEKDIEALNKDITHFITEKKQIDADLQIIETAKKWLADVENLQKQAVEAKQKLPELEQKVEIARKTFEQSEINLNAAKIEKENNDKIFVKVRELDTKIAEKNKLLNFVLQALSELEQTKKTVLEAVENHKRNLSEKRELLRKNQEWATTNTKYEFLTGQFTAIENQHLQVSALLNDYNSKKNELEKVKRDLNAQIFTSQNVQILFSEKEKALNEKEQELTRMKANLLTILSGKALDAYMKEKDEIVKFGTQIKDLIEVEKRISENRKEIEKYKIIIVASEKSEKELSKHIADNKIVAETLKIQIELLDENIKLARTVQSLDEHRKSLEDGKPCPLCGSYEHPFAVGNVPKIGDKETELKNMKKKEQEIANAAQQNEKTLTKLTSENDNAKTNKENAEKYLSENTKKQDAILGVIKRIKPEFSTPTGENRISLLETICSQKRNEYKQIDNVISKATQNEEMLKKLQDDEIPPLQQAKQAAEKAKTDAQINQKLLEQKMENQSKITEDADKKYREENAELLKTLAKYDATSIETLKKCLDFWNSNKKTIEELKEQITKLENLHALKSSEIESNQKQIGAKITEKHDFETGIQTFALERYSLMGDKRVEDEEKRLKDRLEKAENAKTDAEKSKTNAVTELAKNQAVIAQKEKELNQKRAENITKKTSEDLQAEYAEKKPQSDLFSQKIGATRQALNSNDENMERNRNKLKEKELQQQIFAKWLRLNELIGSQDGKKYRNFAQALTFEHLLGLANRQLQKMSDRYILKRAGDAANPFELSVIDKFQNCEERTAQNLSGGEIFIVSLALALGLANMAGKNMNIETMFIDEGFATLDSDYLDVALNALSNLQNEGKLIGVISHLSELKERIATHIEIIPKGNGHSRISLL